MLRAKQYPADRILEILLAGLHCGDYLRARGPKVLMRSMAAARIASLPDVQAGAV
jgi:hypothetical protein